MVECGICYEVMTESRVLECLHHFCPSCINKMIKNRVFGSRITCPNCSHITPEHKIKSSFMMNNLTDIYKDLNDGKIQDEFLNGDETQDECETNCSHCNKPNPSMVCLHCNIQLCNKCKDKHLKLMKEHTIILKQEVENFDLATMSRLWNKYGPTSTRPNAQPNKIKKKWLIIFGLFIAIISMWPEAHLQSSKKSNVKIRKPQYNIGVNTENTNLHNPKGNIKQVNTKSVNLHTQTQKKHQTSKPTTIQYKRNSQPSKPIIVYPRSQYRISYSTIPVTYRSRRRRYRIPRPRKHYRKHRFVKPRRHHRRRR